MKSWFCDVLDSWGFQGLYIDHRYQNGQYGDSEWIEGQIRKSFLEALAKDLHPAVIVVLLGYSKHGWAREMLDVYISIFEDSNTEIAMNVSQTSFVLNNADLRGILVRLSKLYTQTGYMLFMRRCMNEGCKELLEAAHKELIRQDRGFYSFRINGEKVVAVDCERPKGSVEVLFIERMDTKYIDYDLFINSFL